MSESSQANPSMSPTAGKTEKDGRTVYEVGFHLVPTLSEGDLAGAVDAVRAILTKEGAEVLNDTFPKKITFAYRIERSVTSKVEKYTEGYFGWIKFVVDASATPTIAAALRANMSVLRFIIVETTREDAPAPRRAVFASSTRLEGKTIEKPAVVEEKTAEVSEEDLNKSIDALVA